MTLFISYYKSHKQYILMYTYKQHHYYVFPLYINLTPWRDSNPYAMPLRHNFSRSQSLWMMSCFASSGTEFCFMNRPHLHTIYSEQYNDNSGRKMIALFFC
jgi:hypothetical protein